MINIKNHLKRLKPKAGNTIFISVDGHGGSGKSTFAKYLSELLEAELIERNCGGGKSLPCGKHSREVA